MSDHTTTFVLPNPTVARHALREITAALPNARSHTEPLTLTYYDSFDWRVLGAGFSLVHEHGPLPSRLVLLDENDQVVATAQTDQVPKFAWEAPPGPIQEQLFKALGVRALLTKTQLAGRRKTYNVVDDEQKTRLRIVLLTLELSVGDENRSLPARLQLQPVRGYEDAFEKALAVCGDIPELSIAPASLLRTALNTSDRDHFLYSSKPGWEVDPRAPALAATVTVLRELLGMIRANEQGTCDNIDTEFLHDFRVAVRRTRSAITQIKGVLPEDAREHFRNEFAWLGAVTGPTRDLDVYLLHFDDYQRLLDADLAVALQPLKQFLEQKHREEQDKLVEALHSERYRNLVREWDAFLQEPSEIDEETPNAARPITAVADRRIWRLFRRAIKEGEAITADSPADDLHELRKTCKKLRYMIEFFQSLYPADRVKPTLKRLKRFQDILGEHQDLDVQSESLRHFGEEMVARNVAGADTLMAMGVLVNVLRERQQKVRETFAEHFAEFADEAGREAFAALFHHREDAGAQQDE